MVTAQRALADTSVFISFDSDDDAMPDVQVIKI
jgi:hypothetical protein